MQLLRFGPINHKQIIKTIDDRSQPLAICIAIAWYKYLLYNP
jgi:hypothetical protein